MLCGATSNPCPTYTDWTQAAAVAGTTITPQAIEQRFSSNLTVIGINLETNVVSPHPFSYNGSCAGADKWIQHDIIGL